MNVTIPCTVLPGTNPDQVHVTIVSHLGMEFHAVVSTADVTAEEAPEAGRPVPGRLATRLIRQEFRTVLVQLPDATRAGRTLVAISLDLVRRRGA